ncbi:hypothetical protein KA531_03520 [Candidatus Saccharibacteria bacterium]|nr:hypothetical protein [Candidatus Saccharibacteria bacterium]
MYRIVFKKIALTGKVTIFGSQNQIVAYAQQKFFKVKEKVTFYQDTNKDQIIGIINADKIIDYNLSYSLTGAQGEPLCKLKRNGRASIWKANYEILDKNGQLVYKIHEKNPWAKVMDSLLGEIPFIGLINGYIFHVRYGLSTPDGQEVAEIVKQPGLFEAEFHLSLTGSSGDLSVEILELITMLLIRERSRS